MKTPDLTRFGHEIKVLSLNKIRLYTENSPNTLKI